MDFLRQEPLAHLVLMRLLMEPLRQYLGKQFKRAGDQWEREELGRIAAARAAGHEYHPNWRVLHIALGEDDRQFAIQLHILSSAKELWAIVPPTFHTVGNRALAFRCISRMGCSHHKLLATRHQKFPFRVFLLLRSPSRSDEFSKVPNCLLDSWTKKLKALYPSLEGDEFLYVLETIAKLLKVDITNVESRHASVRRMLVCRSTQTHPMGFGDLSGQWLFQQLRNVTTMKRNKRAYKSKKKAQKRKRKSDTPAGSAKANKKKRCRPGFGGAWRAWERLYSGRYRMPSGAADVSEMARAYRVAKMARTFEYLKAESLGVTATLQGRKSASHGFGGRKQSSERAMASVRKWALALQMRAWTDDPAARSLALASYASSAGGLTAKDAISLAKASKALDRKENAALEEALAKALATFQAGEGAHVVNAVKATFPGLQHFPMVAHPSPTGAHVEIAPPSASDVGSAVTWMSGTKRKSTLAPTVEGQWAIEHKQLMSRQCPPVPAAPEDTECYKAGMCLCTPDGQMLRRRALKFIKTMKAVCTDLSGYKKALAEGELVVRLFGSPKTYDDIMEDESAFTEMWLHIGLH